LLAQRWPNVGMPTPTIYQPNQPFANVGPTHDCYLGWEFDKNEKIRKIMGKINICALGS